MVEVEEVGWRVVGVFIAAPLQPPLFFFLFFFFGGGGVEGGGADCSSYSSETGG